MPFHHYHVASKCLFLVLVALVVDHVEESQFIDTLAGRHDTQPVAELLLLEELLRPVHLVSPVPTAHLPRVERNVQVLQVSAGERNVRDDLDLFCLSQK